MEKMTSMNFRSRKVLLNLLSREQGEGVGARVRRTIGRQELRSFDPFLMLDEFKSGAPGGFPDHPHRGFETVTYLLPTSKGSFVHEDFCGHKGMIGPGDLQWMTAGRGIVHSEMPVSPVEAHGLQLWVNLPRRMKMIEPRYQELLAKDLPKVKKDGVMAIVIAGQALGIESPVYTHTPIHYTHFIMDPGSELNQVITSTYQSFVYTLAGSAQIGQDDDASAIDAHHVVTLDQNGDGIQVKAGKEGFEFVLVSGEPIGENVVQHGPFVMNTQEEIYQTMEDFQMGKNGFENAKTWSSSR